jgi:hypothetical protein
VSKVIPFYKDPIKNLSDTEFAEIEKDLIEYFNDAVHKNQGNTPIFKAKEYAVKCIAEKHNFSIEEANRFVSEMQMRKLDKELFDDNET